MRNPAAKPRPGGCSGSTTAAPGAQSVLFCTLHRGLGGAAQQQRDVVRRAMNFRYRKHSGRTGIVAPDILQGPSTAKSCRCRGAVRIRVSRRWTAPQDPQPKSCPRNLAKATLLSLRFNEGWLDSCNNKTRGGGPCCHPAKSRRSGSQEVYGLRPRLVFLPLSRLRLGQSKHLARFQNRGFLPRGSAAYGRSFRQRSMPIACLEP